MTTHTFIRPFPGAFHRRLHRPISEGCLSAATFIAVFFVLLTITAFNPARAAESSLKEILPTQGFAPEWAIDGKVELYDKDTLFNHINGEAELYFPYGFESLASANYVNRKNPDLSLVADVYRMASVLDAFGIYSNYRKPASIRAAVGAGGFVSPSQLLFYQDRYFVRLQVTGATGLPQEILLACARAVSQNLPPGSDPPEELKKLAIPALVPQSERYFAQSLLGYAFFRKGMIADARINDDKMQIFVIREDTQAAARKTFDRYHAYLTAEAQNIQLTENGNRIFLAADDPLYGGVQVEQTGPYIIGAVRVKNKDSAKPILEQLRRLIRAEAGG